MALASARIRRWRSARLRPLMSTTRVAIRRCVSSTEAEATRAPTRRPSLWKYSFSKGRQRPVSRSSCRARSLAEVHSGGVSARQSRRGSSSRVRPSIARKASFASRIRPSGSVTTTPTRLASDRRRSRVSVSRRASSARRRSIPCARASAIEPRRSRVASVSGVREKIAITPTSRSATTSGYPAKARIPSRRAQASSEAPASARRSFVRKGRRSAAIRPTRSAPTGTRAWPPSRCV